MKIYCISILEQYYIKGDNFFSTDLYTNSVPDSKLNLKKKRAIKIAKSIFEQLSEKEEYQQEYAKFIENQDEGRFSLKTTEGNFLSIFVNELVG